MTTLQQVKSLITSLQRAERAQVLPSIARDLGDAFPGIEATPGVCGGEPCIVRTRIPVRVLGQAGRLGTGEADLLRSYPTHRAGSRQRGGTYYPTRPAGIDQQTRANETE